MAGVAEGRASSKGHRKGDLRLSVEGYKAIKDNQELRIAPLTVLAGANSSGKSSFLQPFLMMKQTLDSAFDPGPLLLYGPNVRITERSQMMSRGKSRADISDILRVGMYLADESRIVTFGMGGQDIQIVSDDLVLDAGRLQLVQSPNAGLKSKIRRQWSDLAERYAQSFKETDVAIDSWDLAVDRSRCFLEVVLELRDAEKRPVVKFSPDFAAMQKWVHLLRGIIHVPGLRGNPERAYSRSAVGTSFPGTFETYVASIIYEWTLTSDTRLREVGEQLERLGLTWKIKGTPLNDASIALLVGRTPHAQQGGANDLVSLADVGFGVSQTLPVLVSLLVARKGQIVYLEQPEIHLHPRAQVALADVLVSAAARGVRVIAETHSALLIRGIQTAIARGALKPRDVSLNWFSRDPETGFQDISTAELDAQGRLGEWPLDFDDVSRDADWAYLDAVNGEGSGT